MSPLLKTSSIESHVYMPQDPPSCSIAPPESNSGSLGAGYSVSVRINSTSVRTCGSSKAAPRDGSNAALEASGKIAGNSSAAMKLSSVCSILAAPTAAVNAPSEGPSSGLDNVGGNSYETAVNHSTMQSHGTNASSTESHYLDAMMSTTKSGLELDFSSDVSGQSPLGSRSPPVQVPSSQQQKTKRDSQTTPQGTHASGDAAVSQGCSDPSQNLAFNHHGQASSALPVPHTNEGDRTDEASAKFYAEKMAEATMLVDASGVNGAQYIPRFFHPQERSSTADAEGFAASPSPSPLPACPSLPLVCPESTPKVGDVLGGRFLLRRVVGTSPAAIIYAANDLQEGSVPCSVRMPAPKAPIAASMIALGRMQWLRGQLSQSEGATSLVQILSMPNLLGHGVIVATESLEASVRGRMNLINSGKGKPFSSSDLRSVARQVCRCSPFCFQELFFTSSMSLLQAERQKEGQEPE
jgi:hypothetical protein